jgi:hypothetical protein
MCVNSKYFVNEDSEIFDTLMDLSLPKFVRAIDSINNDSKLTKVLSAGLTDGSPSDEKVWTRQMWLKVSDLIPTQNELDMEKTLKDVTTNRHGNLNTFFTSNAKLKKPIVVLNGRFILDGHHRWSSVYMVNPSAKILSNVINAPITPIEALKMCHMALVVSSGENSPVREVDGKNLYSCSRESVAVYIKKYLSKDSLRIFGKYYANDTLKSAFNLIWSNIETMRENNPPIKGAVERKYMPQTFNANDFYATLQSGIVNFIEPSTTDVKENFGLSGMLSSINYG